MTHTEQQRFSIVQVVSLDEEFAEVRRSFLTRLHDEQARLATLATALGCAAPDPTPVFCDLEYFAHRLQGAAAVFELPTLRAAAIALELAAAAAAGAGAPNCEPLVQEAIRALDIRLAVLKERAPPSEVAVEFTPTN